MIDFSPELGVVALLLEVLRQRDHLRHGLAKVGLQIVYLCCIGPQAGHQAGARGRADRLLAVGPIKDHPRPGQSVDVGRQDVVFAVAAQFGSQVVYGNE